jgi:hypothetical protein
MADGRWQMADENSYDVTSASNRRQAGTFGGLPVGFRPGDRLSPVIRRTEIVRGSVTLSVFHEVR